MALTRPAVVLGVAVLLLLPASVAAASPSAVSTWPHGSERSGLALRAAHGHHAAPSHVDPAPRGVDVHAPVSPATFVARSGVRRHPARLRPVGHAVASAGSRRVAADAATPSAVLDVPAGTPGNPDLTQHVSPSCTGTGTDGNRVQVLYAYEAGQPNHLADVVTALQSAVADVDDTFALSSPAGNRRVRWVTTPDCVPDIRAVELPAGSFADTQTFALDAIADAADAAGIQTSGRKLLTFADANDLCGIGEIYPDDSAASTNTNNVDIPMVARVDTGCWSMAATGHSTPAHELTHMLGGVQDSAPHATTYNHCTDENDVMCYADGGLDHAGAPARMRDVCHAAWSERVLDCGRDDYFNAGTPATGSYLATHWNTARSSYLDIVSTHEVSQPTPSAAVAGATSLRPGLAATYTATPGVPAAVRWTANAPGCLPSGVTTTSIRVQCPSSYHGTLVLTATFTTADQQRYAATRSVSLTGASAVLSVPVALPTSVAVGSSTTLAASARYGTTPVRAVMSAQYLTSVSGVRTWRTFATTTTSASGNAAFATPRWTTTGTRSYRVVVTRGVGSGWTGGVSVTRSATSVRR